MFRNFSEEFFRALMHTFSFERKRGLLIRKKNLKTKEKRNI